MLVRVLTLVPRLVIFPIGASTPIVLAAQVAGWRFSTTATLCALSATSVIAWLLTSEFNQEKSSESVDDRSTGLRLLFAGILSASIAFIIHRPDADDYHYVPNAVFFLGHPDKAMDFGIHYLVTSSPVQSISWGTSLTYEYAVGFVSYFTGIDFLMLYHRIFPPAFAFAWPCAMFGLSQHFTQKQALAASGCLVMVVLASGMGDTHRTLGNLSLARFFQGKYIALSLGLPLHLDILAGVFLRAKQRRNLEGVFGSLAMIGLSATGALLTAASTAILGFAAFLMTANRGKTRVLRLAFALAATPSVYLLFIRFYFPAGVEESNTINAGWPTRLAGHLAFFWNPSCPFTPSVVLISLLSLPWVARNRGFLTIWLVSVFVLLLTPWTARLIIAHLSGPNVYWRLLYLLPFPLLIVVGVERLGAFLENNFENGPWEWAKRWGVVVAGLVVVVAFPGSSIFRQANAGLRFDLQPLLPEGGLEAARAIVSACPEGAMISPPEIAGIVAMLSANHPQARVREDAMILWFGPAGDGTGNLRIAGSDFLDGRSGTKPADLYAVLHKFPALKSVVARANVATPALAHELSSNWGFVNQKQVTGDFVVFARAP